jgi:hypothetical protein
MASGQSKKEETKASSEGGEDKGENGSSPDEASKKIKKTSDVQGQDQEDEDDSLIADILPPEVLERLPDKEKRQIVSSLSIMMGGSSRQSSPIAKQLKPEHITQIIENSEKDSQREFERTKISENTKRWGMGAILSLVVIVLVYAGTTRDKELSEKVILAGISAIGGFGAGYAVAKNK